MGPTGFRGCGNPEVPLDLGVAAPPNAGRPHGSERPVLARSMLNVRADRKDSAWSCCSYF